MRACARGLGAAIVAGLILAGCTSKPETETVYRTKEVPVEVPVMCPISVATVEGPDFPASDSNIEYAATYVEGRIIALRKALSAAREAVEDCRSRIEKQP